MHFSVATIVSVLTLLSNSVFASVHPWTQVVILAGEFASARIDFEKIKDATDPEQAIPTLVLHDPPGPNNSVAYRIHYCAREYRLESGCFQGGVETIPLNQVQSTWSHEVDLGRSDTISAFLIFAAKRYPSQRFALTLKGRSGFGHVLEDDLDDNQDPGLTIEELRQALQDLKQVRGVATDIVVLASSLSASVENAWSLASVANSLVATEEGTSNGRLAYFRIGVWTVDLREDPSMDDKTLARRIAWIYRDPAYASYNSDVPHQVSAVDLSVFSSLQERLREDLTSLLSLGNEGMRLIEQAWANASLTSDQSTRMDLGALLAWLQVSSQDLGLSEPIGSRSAVLLNNLMIQNYNQNDLPLSGLSIFLPVDPAIQWKLGEKYHQRFEMFADQSQWQQVLQRRISYLRSQQTGCQTPDSNIPSLWGWLLWIAFIVWQRNFYKR